MPDARINAAVPKYSQTGNRYLTDRQLKQRNATLEGVVVNNFIKDPENQERPNLDDTYNALLISDREHVNTDKYIPEKNKDDREFNSKKAIIPLMAGAAAIFGAGALLSILMVKSARKITTEPFKNKLQPMGLNINIRQEPEFSAYMALRDPTFENVMAMAAVFAFSGITLAAKKFVEGYKKIWIKKQDADIQRNLQENLIQVETEAFSGKLAVVRDMLSTKGEYFKNAINSQNAKNSQNPSVFKEHFSFKGIEENNNVKNETENKDSKIKKILNPHNIACAATLLLGVGTAIFIYKGFKKSAGILEGFKHNVINKQEDLLEKALNDKSQKDLAEVLIKMGVVKDKASEYGKKIGLSGEELEQFANKVGCDVNTLWGNPPTGMSTESGKAFFYCYLNEPRGHLYNWLIHNDNPFLKYLWIVMSTVCGGSYLAGEAADGIKEAAVLKENAKTELGLQKRLVEVEINNFRAKKESAIAPLTEEFERQRKEGKSPAELKIMADNILLEIKNGPPFVYS